MERVSKGLADPEFTIEDMIAEGDLVAVRLTAAATHAGEFMGMPATGKRYEIARSTSSGSRADGSATTGTSSTR